MGNKNSGRRPLSQEMKRHMVIDKAWEVTRQALDGEIALANKDKTYEKFIYANSWVKEFWPNALKLQVSKYKTQNSSKLIASLIEPLARRLQAWYMRGKITREIVGRRRAIFHPYDWGSLVLSKLTP